MTLQITGNDAQFNKDITILGDLEIYGSIKSKTNDTLFDFSDNFIVKTNETERLRITNDGKVGINVKNPLGTVDIVNSGADASDLNSLGVQINAAWIRIGDVDATGKTFSNGLGVKFYDQGTAHWSYGILEDDFLIANTSLDGNKLFPSNRTAPFIIKYDGKVGIGTENPATTLHAYHSTNNTVAKFESGDDNVVVRFKDADTTNEIGIGAISNDFVVTAATGGERLRITSAGNVGIGTTNPTAKLDVNGALNVTGIVTATSFSGVGAFVSGMIILWSGAADAIPSGFVLCDGNNSTPDLRDRFVVGAGSGYAVNATGGSADATLPSHYHNYPGDDQLTAANGKSGGTQFGTTPTWSNTFDDNFNYDATSTLSGGAKLWRTTTVGESVTNKNLPPYYALCYIMKT